MKPSTMMQRVSLNGRINNSEKKGLTAPYKSSDQRRSSSSTLNQFGSVKSGSGKAGHQDYLKNMLINRILKKYPGADGEIRNLVIKEVNAFCESEYVTKETIKQLESRVSLSLQQNLAENSPSYRYNTESDTKNNLDPRRNATQDVKMANANNGELQQQNKYDSYKGYAKTLRRQINNQVRLVNGGLVSATPSRGKTSMKGLPNLNLSNGQQAQSRDMLVGQMSGSVGYNPPKVDAARSSSLMLNPELASGKHSPLSVFNKIDMKTLAAQRQSKLEGGSKQSTSRAILKEAQRRMNENRNQAAVAMYSHSSGADNESSPVNAVQKKKINSILMERGTASAYSPIKLGAQKPKDVTQRESMPASLSTKPSADLIGISTLAENRPRRDVINKGKSNLGIQYDSIDSQIRIQPSLPQKTLAQSIEVVKKPANRISMGSQSLRNNGSNLINARQGSQNFSGYQQQQQQLVRQKAYEPENRQNSGGILAKQISLEELDSAVRVGGQSGLSLGVDRQSIAVQNSMTQQPSRGEIRKKRLETEEDEPWAEVAKFNQLLDLKIKLDEASDLKRKANVQKSYLDQQLKAKAGVKSEAQREKEQQHKRMQKLIDQVARDKTDQKNRETLKKMQEKTAKINAVNNEKRRKEEQDRLERFTREQLLQVQIEGDKKHKEEVDARRQEHALSLKQMNEENLIKEKQRNEAQKRQQEANDKKFLSEGIKVSEAQQRQRALDIIAMKKRNSEYERKVALAAMGITHSRDIEKTKLTNINLNKQKLKEEQLHLQNHLKREIIKTQSTQQLKSDLQEQISQRKNQNAIERSMDQAQLVHNRQLDQEHWQNEQKQQNDRRQRHLEHERQLMEQINQKRKGSNSPDLHINKDYINNIKQIKDLLQEEIQLKEAVIVPKTSGKKLLGHLQPNNVQVIGLQKQFNTIQPGNHQLKF